MNEFKSSSQNRIFKKKKTLNNSKNEKKKLGLGSIPDLLGFWVWMYDSLKYKSYPNAANSTNWAS